MKILRKREVNWKLVKVLYDDVCGLLTFKQYVKWTMDADGHALGGTYWERFARLPKVTKSKRILKLARAATYEITGSVANLTGNQWIRGAK